MAKVVCADPDLDFVVGKGKYLKVSTPRAVRFNRNDFGESARHPATGTSLIKRDEIEL